MMSELPFISVIIPCFNEVKYVTALINNLMTQDYPKDRVEIIFSDGMSTDGTRELLRTSALQHQSIRLIDNPDRYVSSALNAAIRICKGEIVIRMDAHSVYPTNYWSMLVTKLAEHHADNVGGVWDTQPGSDTLEAKAIVLATTHPLGIGNASYRLGGLVDKQVDTVPFGCFRRDIFTRIGLFDEDLLRNQDDEFNGRIIKGGGKIVLIPSLRIKYFARDTFSKTSRMFYQYGLFKPLVNLKLGSPATIRQFAPPLLVLSIVLLLIFAFVSKIFLVLFLAEVCIYMLSVVLVSATLAKDGGFRLWLLTIITFPVIHFSYGIGYIFGLYRYTLLQSHKRKGEQRIASSR